MYCDTPQVNQLTALLQAHGIHDVVVCPGSRNGTIVHNLHAAGTAFCLHPITDERSAAFVALGICLATQEPAAVCVTSGSALLGCLPAVAEAFYRNLPLLVISADRPAQWVGQLDGQTLQQVGTLLPYCPTCNVCIPQGPEDHWANNRRINEALNALSAQGGGPAHINVQIAEPMFSFTTRQLPNERVVRRLNVTTRYTLPNELLKTISKARLPALVIGQYERGDLRNEIDLLEGNGQLLVLPEVLSDVPNNWRIDIFDQLDETAGELIPDVVIQLGGNFVHKRFKRLLRQATDCRVIRIGYDREAPDTFCHLDGYIQAPELPILQELCAHLPHHHAGVTQAQKAYALRQDQRLQTTTATGTVQGQLTFAGVTRLLQQALQGCSASYSLHLANSTAVREAGKVFESGRFPIFCNRGVNGIEGSLSTAVGYALKMWGLSIVLIGDLSFFYDANALWNTELPSNLRILLFNNGHGAIFDHLPGLDQSPARDRYIAAGQQHFSAEGIAHTFGTDYMRVDTEANLTAALFQWLLPTDKACILEVTLPADNHE